METTAIHNESYMNIYFLTAGILCLLLGLVHSILGERLIFRSKRQKGSLVPTKTSTLLKKPHLRIIWATWHFASIFGWCVGALLIKIALEPQRLDHNLLDFIINSTIITVFTSSLLVIIGTKARHPGWVVLFLIGLTLMIGNC